MEKSGQIGDIGSYDVLVDDQGKVVAKVQIAKDVSVAKASVSIEVDIDIFSIAEAIAAKTATTWDDAAVKLLEQLLGVKKPA